MTTTEPVAWSTAVAAAIPVVIAALVAFNVWHPTDAQVASVSAVYAAFIAILGTVVRSKVTPVAGAQNPDTKV